MAARKNPHAVALGRKGGLAARGRNGRPKVLRPCPNCRQKFSARELRAHVPRCA